MTGGWPRADNESIFWRPQVRPVRVVGDVAYVPLTRGLSAVIDATDAPELGRYNWCAAKNGSKHYAIRGMRVGRRTKMVRMHNLLCPTAPGEHVDHIDGDSLNNRRSNLRRASPTLNALNAEREPPRSGAGNVVRMKRSGLWRAFKTERGKSIPIGDYLTVGDAELAVMKWRTAAMEAQEAALSKATGGSDE